MKSTLVIIIGAALGAAIILASSSRDARAGSEFDCSSIQKWVKRTNSYDRGTVVAHKLHSSDAHFHGFKCDVSLCGKEPTTTRDWIDVGECKYGTDPR